MLKKWLGNKEKNSLVAKVDKLSNHEVKSMILEILNKLESLENNAESLEKINEDFCKNNLELLEEREDEITKIHDSYNQRIKDLEVKINKLLDDEAVVENKLKEFKSNEALKMQEFKEKHSTKLKDLNNSAETDINEALNELKSGKKLISEDINNQLKSIKEDFDKIAGELQHEVDKKVEEIELASKNHEEKLKSLEEDYNAKTNDLKSNIANLEKDNRELESDHNHSSNKYMRELNELSSKHENKVLAIKKMIERTRVQLEEESNNVVLNNQNILRDLLAKEKDLSAYLLDTQKELEAEKLDLQHKFEIKLNELNEQETHENTKYQEILNRYNTENKNYEAKLEGFKQEKERLVATNQALIEKLDAEAKTLEESNKKKLLEYTTNNDADLAKYRAEQLQLIENQKLNDEARIKSLKDNLANEETRLMNLINNLAKIKTDKEVEYNTELNKTKTALDEIRKINQDKRHEYALALHEKEEEIKALAESQRVELLALEKELKDARIELQTRIDETKANGKLEADKQLAVNADLDAKINDLKHNHELLVESDKLKVTNKTKEYEDRVNTLHKAQERITRLELELKEELATHEANHKKEIASLEVYRKDIVTKHQAALEELEKLHITNRKELETKYANLKNDYLNEFNSKMALVKEDADKLINNLNETDGKRNADYELRLNKIEEETIALVAHISSTISKEEKVRLDVINQIKANELKFDQDNLALKEEVANLNKQHDLNKEAIRNKHLEDVKALEAQEKQAIQELADAANKLKLEENARIKELNELRTSNDVFKNELDTKFNELVLKQSQAINEEEKKRADLLLELNKTQDNNQLEIPHLNKVLAETAKEVNNLEFNLNKELNTQINMNNEKLLTFEEKLKQELELLNIKHQDEYNTLEDKNFNEYQEAQSIQREKELEYLETIKNLQAKKADIRKEYLENSNKVASETIEIKDELERNIKDYNLQLDELRNEIITLEQDHDDELKFLRKVNEDNYFETKNLVNAKVKDAREVNANLSDSIDALKSAIVSETQSIQRYKEDLLAREKNLETIYENKLNSIKSEVENIKSRMLETVSKHSVDTKTIKDKMDELETKRSNLLVEHPVKLSEEMYQLSFELERRKEDFDKKVQELETRHQEIIVAIINKQRDLIADTQNEIAKIDEHIKRSVEETLKSNEDYQNACNARLEELSKPKYKYQELAKQGAIDFKNDEEALRNELNDLRKKFEEEKALEAKKHNLSIQAINDKAGLDIRGITKEGEILASRLAITKEDVNSLFNTYNELGNKFSEESNNSKDFVENGLNELSDYIDSTVREVNEILKKNDIISDKHNLMDFFR